MTQRNGFLVEQKKNLKKLRRTRIYSAHNLCLLLLRVCFYKNYIINLSFQVGVCMCEGVFVCICGS